MFDMPQKGFLVENSTNLKWPQKLASLTSNSIFWYTRDWEVKNIILSCGDFPNVSLIESRGCINYNPVLALRQLSYPMSHKSEDKLLENFVLYEGAEDPSMLKKVKQARGRLNKKRKELSKKNYINKEPYTQWVKERVKKVKLPFDIKLPTQPRSSNPIPITMEEGGELKETILRLEKEKEELQGQLNKSSGENSELK